LSNAVSKYNGKKKDMLKDPYCWSDPKHGKVFHPKHKDIHGKIVTYTDQRPGVMIVFNEILALKTPTPIPAR
jgi:hypothetical protein